MKISYCNRLVSKGLLVALLYLGLVAVGQAQEWVTIIPASPAQIH